MSDEALMALIESYKEHILDENESEEFRNRMLVGLCRDIERETLRNAVRGMRAAVSAVDERIDVRSVLVAHENSLLR
jgi:hypothetical protein